MYLEFILLSTNYSGMVLGMYWDENGKVQQGDEPWSQIVHEQQEIEDMRRETTKHAAEAAASLAAWGVLHHVADQQREEQRRAKASNLLYHCPLCGSVADGSPASCPNCGSAFLHELAPSWETLDGHVLATSCGYGKASDPQQRKNGSLMILGEDIAYCHQNELVAQWSITDLAFFKFQEKMSGNITISLIPRSGDPGIILCTEPSEVDLNMCR